MSEKLNNSKITGKHALLNKLVGEWEGTARTWFEPDTVADESPISGTMKPVLDGRFILHEYKGSFGGKPLEGIALFGYHLELEKFQSAWVDSFHNGTAIMFSDGTRKEDRFSMLGSYTYVGPDAEQKWGWRTEIEIVNDDHIKLVAYNITPEGEEARATEIDYRRKP